MDLKAVIQSLVPDNIKAIPLVKYSIDAFAEMLSVNSTISYRVQKIFDVDDSPWYKRNEDGSITPMYSSDYDDFDGLDPNDPNKQSNYLYLTNAKNTLKKGLFYTYLSVMFELIEKLYKNADVIKTIKLRDVEFSSKLREDNPYDIVNSEYLGAFRYFQESSGTVNAIKYIYQFSRYLETGVIDDSLDLTEGDPFFLEYNGELHKSIFLGFNQPMSHPCGWCFQYNTIVKKVLEDYYGIKIIYNIKNVIIVKGFKRIIFGTVPASVKSWHIVQDQNIADSLSILNQFDVVKIVTNDNSDLTITDVSIQDDETNITFNTGKLLYVTKKSIKYGTSNNLFTFPSSYVMMPLNLSDYDYKFLYRDEMVIEDTLEASKYGNDFYYEDNFNKAFKLSGGTYPYIPGIDESRHKVTNDSNLYNAFTCSIQFTSKNLTYLNISDDFGHSFVRVLESGNEIKVCTHGFYGDYLTFRAYDGLSYNYDHYVRLNTLNNLTSTIKISNFSIQNNKLQFRAVSTVGSIHVTVDIENVQYANSYGSSVDYSLDTSNYPQFSGYKITITNYNDTVIIEGNGLNNTNVNFTFSLPSYSTANIVKPVFINCTPDTMNNMPTGVSLGALNETNGLMYFHDTILEDYNLLTPDGSINISDLNPRNHKGCCFINRGFEKIPSDGSDCIVPSCSKYVDDDFYCETSGYTSWLEFSNSAADGSLGKYLVCHYNNDPQTDIVRGMLFGYVLTFKG